MGEEDDDEATTGAAFQDDIDRLFEDEEDDATHSEQ